MFKLKINLQVYITVKKCLQKELFNLAILNVKEDMGLELECQRSAVKKLSIIEDLKAEKSYLPSVGLMVYILEFQSL